MEDVLIRLKEKLLTLESRDTRMGLNHFSDEIGCEKKTDEKEYFFASLFCPTFLLPIFFYFLFCLF